MTDKPLNFAERLMRNRIEASTGVRYDRLVEKSVGPLGAFIEPTPPFTNRGISPATKRRYLDLNAKDTQYMFHEDNQFIGEMVRIKNSGTTRLFKCVGRSETDPECAVLTEHDVFHSSTVRFDRLEKAVGAKLADVPPGFLNMDMMQANPDEAVEWLAFLFLMASRVAQIIPRDSRDELERILTVRGESKTGPVVTAALAYYDASEKWYSDAEEHNP